MGQVHCIAVVPVNCPWKFTFFSVWLRLNHPNWNSGDFYVAWQCFCGFALKTYGHYEESKKTALPEESVYDIAKCGSEAGKLALEYLCWGCFFCVFWCGLVMAEMGSTTKVIFLTHGRVGVCFWLFFQEQEWTLQCHSHAICCATSVPRW